VAEAPAADLFRRLRAALETLDLDGFVSCFHDDFVSEQPLHPELGFTGNDRVRRNWSNKLRPGSDFEAELLRSSVDGDTIWAEWRWGGTKDNGTPRNDRGVVIYGVRGDRVAWSRLYMDEPSTVTG